MDRIDPSLLLYVSSLDIIELFNDCINLFDLVVVYSKEEESKFTMLCAKLCFQRYRLIIWGEALGLVPSCGMVKRASDPQEAGASAMAACKEVLSKFYLSLVDAEVFIEQFYVPEDTPQRKEWERAAALSLPLFCNEFESVRAAVVKAQQKDETFWRVRRWTVHDLIMFSSLIERLEGLLNTLDAIKQPSGFLEQQLSLLTTGIRSIRNPTNVRHFRSVAHSHKESAPISRIWDTLTDVLQPNIPLSDGRVKATESSHQIPAPVFSSSEIKLGVDPGFSAGPTTNSQMSSGVKTLCGACSAISLPMMVYGFRHALGYNQVQESSNYCSICALMLSSYHTLRCVDAAAGKNCNSTHQGRLSWRLQTDGPSVRFGMFKLDSSHYGEAIDVHTNEGSSLFKSGILTRRELQWPDSPRNLRLLKQWLGECRSSHEECKSGLYSGHKFDDEDDSTERLPFRVIDVGPDDGSQPARLVTSDNRLTGRYLTLSHCWGKISPTKTTLATLSQWHLALPEKQLSKTFQDAIWLTRRLGERFLWIDSLCIVQDDPQDLKAQIGLMGKIFEQSYCTIAAVDAKGPDGSFPDEGLFAPRPHADDCVRIKLGHKELLTDVRHHDDPYHEKAMEDLKTLADCSLAGEESHEIFLRRVDDKHMVGPINLHLQKKMWYTRGWVFQEKELSRRFIYFTEEAVAWRCNRYWEAEQNGTHGRERSTAWNAGSFTKGGATHDVIHGFRKRWQAVIEEYSHKKLTYISDKDKALKGFEERLSTQSGAIFRFGLLDFGSKDILLSQLLWLPARGCRNSLRGSPDFTCPTWSWMMVDGGVRWASNECLVGQEALCDVSFGEIQADGRQNLFLSGRSRIVSLEGSIGEIPVFSQRERWPPHTHFGWTELMLDESTKTILSVDGSEIIGWVVMDTNDEPSLVVGAPFMSYWREDSEEEPMCVDFLALAELPAGRRQYLPDDQQTYQRVGRGRVLKNAFSWLEDCQDTDLVVV